MKKMSIASTRPVQWLVAFDGTSKKKDWGLAMVSVDGEKRGLKVQMEGNGSTSWILFGQLFRVQIVCGNKDGVYLLLCSKAQEIAVRPRNASTREEFVRLRDQLCLWIIDSNDAVMPDELMAPDAEEGLLGLKTVTSPRGGRRNAPERDVESPRKDKRNSGLFAPRVTEEALPKVSPRKFVASGGPDSSVSPPTSPGRANRNSGLFAPRAGEEEVLKVSPRKFVPSPVPPLRQISKTEQGGTPPNAGSPTVSPRGGRTGLSPRAAAGSSGPNYSPRGDSDDSSYSMSTGDIPQAEVASGSRKSWGSNNSNNNSNNSDGGLLSKLFRRSPRGGGSDQFDKETVRVAVSEPVLALESALKVATKFADAPTLPAVAAEGENDSRGSEGSTTSPKKIVVSDPKPTLKTQLLLESKLAGRGSDDDSYITTGAGGGALSEESMYEIGNDDTSTTSTQEALKSASIPITKKSGQHVPNRKPPLPAPPRAPVTRGSPHTTFWGTPNGSPSLRRVSEVLADFHVRDSPPTSQTRPSPPRESIKSAIKVVLEADDDSFYWETIGLGSPSLARRDNDGDGGDDDGAEEASRPRRGTTNEVLSALTQLEEEIFASSLSKEELDETMREAIDEHVAENKSTSWEAKQEAANRLRERVYSVTEPIEEQDELPPLPDKAPPMDDRVAYRDYMRLRSAHRKRQVLQKPSNPGRQGGWKVARVTLPANAQQPDLQSRERSRAELAKMTSSPDLSERDTYALPDVNARDTYAQFDPVIEALDKQPPATPVSPKGSKGRPALPPKPNSPRPQSPPPEERSMNTLLGSPHTSPREVQPTSPRGQSKKLPPLPAVPKPSGLASLMEAAAPSRPGVLSRETEAPSEAAPGFLVLSRETEAPSQLAPVVPLSRETEAPSVMAPTRPFPRPNSPRK